MATVSLHRYYLKMPLPIGHGALGAVVVAVVHPTASLKNWHPLFWGAVVANCPDLDFIFVWGFHLPGAHRGFTHSLLFALLVAITIACWTRRARWRAALAFSLAYLSHTLLDFATCKVGGGVKQFPHASRYYYAGCVHQGEVFKEIDARHGQHLLPLSE